MTTEDEATLRIVAFTGAMLALCIRGDTCNEDMSNAEIEARSIAESVVREARRLQQPMGE